MKSVFMWFGVYLVLFIGLACMVLHADSELDVLVALNMLTCAGTFAYTFCFRERIAKEPKFMLSVFLLLLLFIFASCPFAAYVLCRSKALVTSRRS